MTHLAEYLFLLYGMVLYAMMIVAWQWLPWESVCLFVKVLIMPLFVIYGYILWREFDMVVR